MTLIGTKRKDEIDLVKSLLNRPFRTSVRAFLLLATALMVCTAFAQTVTPPITDAVPKIDFQPWKEVDRTELTVEYEASFPSALTTGYAANDLVPLKILVPVEHQGPVPVVMVLHYLGARDLRVERSISLDLNRRGIAAVILTLPYHMGRTPKGFLSGQLAIQPDPDKLIETMTQAVFDARRTIDFIETREEFQKEHIGIVGTSLGAVVSTLVYALEPRITHATFILGGVDLAKILWNSSIVVKQREELRRKGYTLPKLTEALAPIEPSTFLKNRTPGTTFVIGGRYDTVIPPSTTQELIDALGTPKVLWIETGHYGGVFVQRKLQREVATFFETEFGGKPFIAPLRVYAPTVRIGVQVNPTTGFDLGVGLDFFRTPPKVGTFGTLFFTPRGPQAFIGKQISGGLAFGLSAAPRRIGFGVMWSVVL